MDSNQFQLSCFVIPNFPFQPHSGLFIYVENKYNIEENLIVYKRAKKSPRESNFPIIYLPFVDRIAHFYVSDDDYFGEVLPKSDNFYAFLKEAYPLESDEFAKIIYTASDQHLLVDVGQNVPESICGFIFFTGFRFRDDPIFYYIPWESPCFQSPRLFRQLFRLFHKVWISASKERLSSKLSRDSYDYSQTLHKEWLIEKGYNEYLQFAEQKTNERKLCGTLGFSNDFKTLFITGINDKKKKNKEFPDPVIVDLSESLQAALYCFFISQTKSVSLEKLYTTDDKNCQNVTKQQETIISLHERIRGDVCFLTESNIRKNITNINHMIEDQILRDYVKKRFLNVVENIILGVISKSKGKCKTLNDYITKKEEFSGILKGINKSSMQGNDNNKNSKAKKKKRTKGKERKKSTTFIDKAYEIAIELIEKSWDDFASGKTFTFQDLITMIDNAISNEKKLCSADNPDDKFRCSSFLILRNAMKENIKYDLYAIFLACRGGPYRAFIIDAKTAINKLLGKSKKANSCSKKSQ